MMAQLQHVKALTVDDRPASCGFMRNHLNGSRTRPSTTVVGVRELKTHAARIVRRVREARASYVLTHRGRAVGVILPLDATDGTAQAADDGDAAEPFAVSEIVLEGFLRIVTNAKIFDPPTPMEIAIAFCQRLVEWPRAVMVVPSRQHWDLFAGLCANIQGPLVTDAYLAALAIEHGCEFDPD